MKWTLIFLLMFTEWQAQALTFVVHAENPVSRLTISELKDYYFKRKRTWPDGTTVRFIDRGANSDLRKELLSSYLNMSAGDVDQYWIGQKLYSGDSTPLQQPSELLTLQLVSSLKGSISYVSDSAPLPKKGVKVIRIDDGSF